MQQHDFRIGKSLPLSLLFYPWLADHRFCWYRWTSPTVDCQVFMIREKSMCSSRIISVLSLMDLALQVHHCCQFDLLVHASTMNWGYSLICLPFPEISRFLPSTIFPTIFSSYFTIIQAIFYIPWLFRQDYLDNTRASSNNFIFLHLPRVTLW